MVRTALFQCATEGSIPAARTTLITTAMEDDLAVARAPFAKRTDPSPGCGSTPTSSAHDRPAIAIAHAPSRRAHTRSGNRHRLDRLALQRFRARRTRACNLFVFARPP